MGRPDWKAFINEAVEKSEITLSLLFNDFVNEMELVYLDYDEFEDDSFGEVGVYYFDIRWKEKTLYARRTVQLEGDSWFWGLPDDDGSGHFDVWIEENLNTNTEESYWFLERLEDYYNAY